MRQNFFRLNTKINVRRLGGLFFIILYLAVMSLSSLPLWREERLLFIRCAMPQALTLLVPGTP